MSIFRKQIPAVQKEIVTGSKKELRAQLSQILPFKPKKIELYLSALTHSSCQDTEVSHNERLEYLGDAFLGSIVGELLYLKYPKKDEGFLTEMRSKIVSRQNLNQLAMDLGLNKIVRYNRSDNLLGRSHIFGNALEALIGAIYLDKGFKYTKEFILVILLKHHVDLDELEQTETNFKKGLYQWAQKHNKILEFKSLDCDFSDNKRKKLFNVGIFVDGEHYVTGSGWNKKEASQHAAERALNIISEEESAHNMAGENETNES